MTGTRRCSKAVVVLLAVAGCGKVTTDLGERQGPSQENVKALTDPRTRQLTRQPGAENAPAPVAEGQTAAGTAAVGANPRAALLRPYFLQSLQKPVEGKVDPFRSNLARFAPYVEISTEEAEAEGEEPKTPLEFFDVDSYRLVLIMSATAQAKALVVDPKGKSYVVQAGTRIGNRQGKVVSITATEVRIEEPGRPPVIKSLEPPVSEMERELQAVQEY